MKKIAALLAALVIGLTAGCTMPEDSSSGGSGGGLNSDTAKPNKVKVGSAFRLGDFKIHKGWKVSKEQFLGKGIDGLVVTNVTNKDHGFLVNFKLHKGPHRVIADIQCSADQAHAHEIVDVDCIPDGKANAPWKFITVENTF